MATRLLSRRVYVTRDLREAFPVSDRSRCDIGLRWDSSSLHVKYCYARVL